MRGDSFTGAPYFLFILQLFESKSSWFINVQVKSLS